MPKPYRLLAVVLLFYVSLVGSVCAGDGVHPAEVTAHHHVELGQWEAARLAFVEAAEAGSPTAMAWLAWLHEEGHGVVADPALAVMWYARAVEAGAGHLALKLGWLYLGGDPAIRNRELADQWFLYGIERGDLDAHVALASVIIADALGGLAPQRIHQAREWLLTAHRGRHEMAKFFLARIYLEGIGGHPVDYGQAHYYASLGAEQGHAQMQGWLAHIYRHGLGREADRVEAAKWAMLAAIGGDPLGVQLYAELEGMLDPAELADARERAMAWASR